MPIVRVWNENIYPFEDKDFNGARVVIEPSQFVEMDHDDALKFLSKFHPPVRDADGHSFDPRSFKKLRIEEYEDLAVDVDPLMNHATGIKHDSEKSLKADMEAAIKAGQVSHVKEKPNERNRAKGTMESNTL